MSYSHEHCVGYLAEYVAILKGQLRDLADAAQQAIGATLTAIQPENGKSAMIMGKGRAEFGYTYAAMPTSMAS